MVHDTEKPAFRRYLIWHQQMTTTSSNRLTPQLTTSVIRWLLDSDPSIRWQVMRDLIGTQEDEVSAERAKIATEGWGFQLLSHQSPNGYWGGAAWNRGWNSTMHVLMLLRDLGLDPASDQARSAVDLVRDRVTWKGCGPQECDDNPFFAGEIEPCINAQVATVGAYFCQDVQSIVDKLLAEQLPDGGWNCEAANGSTRSSFNTAICVLEALLEHERSIAANSKATAARLRGQEYLLARRLFRRLSTGEVIERDRKGDASWMRFAFPTWWHYDVLRGLEYPPSRRSARRARSRGDRLGRVQARRRRPVAARDLAPRRDAGRDGRGRGPAEPVEHAARLASVELVFSKRLTQMLLEGTGNEPNWPVQ